MPLIVFNKKASNCDFSWCDEAVDVMRPNVLGNPYPITVLQTRSEVIAKYEIWLSKMLADKNSPQAREIHRLAELHKQGKNIALLCCCAPLDCHANVIKKRVESYERSFTPSRRF